MTGESSGNVAPRVGTSSSWGSNAVNKDDTKSWKPLKTDKTQTNAVVAKAIPMTDIIDIALIALWLFLEKR